MPNNNERTELSQVTRRCLEQAGWLPGRRIGIRAYERELKAEGYSLKGWL